VQVAGHPHVGDRDDLQPRILDLLLDHRGHYLLDARAHPARAGFIDHGGYLSIHIGYN
jgi:hypothetical protein